MTAGQNVKNARRPGPIGFGRIRIRPQPDGREDDDAQQGTATKYEKPEADLEEATLEITIHGPSDGLCSDFTCQSLLMTIAALAAAGRRPVGCSGQFGAASPDSVRIVLGKLGNNLARSATDSNGFPRR